LVFSFHGTFESSEINLRRIISLDVGLFGRSKSIRESIQALGHFLRNRINLIRGTFCHRACNSTFHGGADAFHAILDAQVGAALGSFVRVASGSFEAGGFNSEFGHISPF